MWEDLPSWGQSFWSLWHENCELLNSVFGSLPPTDTAFGTDSKHKRKLLLFFPGSKKITLISYVTCFLLSALKVKQHMAVCHATSYIHIYIKNKLRFLSISSLKKKIQESLHSCPQSLTYHLTWKILPISNISSKDFNGFTSVSPRGFYYKEPRWQHSTFLKHCVYTMELWTLSLLTESLPTYIMSVYVYCMSSYWHGSHNPSQVPILSWEEKCSKYWHLPKVQPCHKSAQMFPICFRQTV